MPLALIGGVYALGITGTPFGRPRGDRARAGLFGIAVMEGILILSYFNRLIDDGAEQATRSSFLEVRLRPVMMTCIAACAGLLPAALSRRRRGLRSSGRPSSWSAATCSRRSSSYRPASPDRCIQITGAAFQSVKLIPLTLRLLGECDFDRQVLHAARAIETMASGRQARSMNSCVVPRGDRTAVVEHDVLGTNANSRPPRRDRSPRRVVRAILPKVAPTGPRPISATITSAPAKSTDCFRNDRRSAAASDSEDRIEPVKLRR